MDDAIATTREAFRAYEAERTRLRTEVTALEAGVLQQRDALLEYGRHKDDCVFWQDDESDLEAYGEGGCCTCGFAEARQ